mgnify:CR=1 FL=1
MTQNLEEDCYCFTCSSNAYRSLAGCGQKAVSIDKENPSINVMTKAYNTESASPDSLFFKNLKNFLVQS